MTFVCVLQVPMFYFIIEDKIAEADVVEKEDNKSSPITHGGKILMNGVQLQANSNNRMIFFLKLKLFNLCH